MADTDIIVSEMTPASQINTGDLMIMTQPDAQAETGYTTKRGTVLQVANKMLKGTEYSTDLPDFTDKTPLGGLEELKADIKALLPIGSASGAIATFETNLADELNSLKCEITASGGNGSPDSPIPLVGHSELNLTRCGKNFADLDDVNATSGGLDYPVLGSVYLTAGTYTLSFAVGSTITGERNRPLYGIGSNVIYCPDDYFSSGRNSWTFTITTSGIYQFKWWYQNLNAICDITDFQLEKGSTATAYEPYKGDTATISFGQTVYGGVYDKSGRLTITHKVVALDQISWDYSGGTLFLASIADCNLVSNPENVANWKCSCFPIIAQSGHQAGVSGISASNWFNGLTFWNEEGYTQATFEAAIAGQTCVYELATPIVIDVPSISVYAEKGVNNIVSDCLGDVSVQYRDSIQHYIDSKIASVQALIL